MAIIEKSIVVDVPVRTAYGQWTQLEEFPRFMDGVESVRQLDARRLHWSAKVLGKTKEWDAEIVEQIPDRLISWRSAGGARNDGTIAFSAQGAAQTRIDVRMDVEPDGPVENTAQWLGLVDRQVDGDIHRFKEFIEGRAVPTGEWRGAIHSGKVEEREEERTG